MIPPNTRTALLHARQHAAICNGLECAPPEPVTATYLQAAYERMRLGVLVDYSKQYGGPGRPFAIFSKEGCLLDCYGSPEAASAAYLALCATLTEPAQASRAATAGADPASTSAISSPSAPLVSPGPGAVAGEVPPIANASPALDSGAR